MARIRTIKPEFWSSEQVMECAPLARLLFLAMWNFADDHGRLPDSPKTLKAQAFPGDDIEVAEVRRMIDELSSNGLLRPYSVDGKGYLLVTGWHHQRIDRPQKPRYPAPPKDDSPNARRTLATDLTQPQKGANLNSSSRPQAAVDSTNAKPTPSEPPATDSQTPDAQLFARAREILGKSCGGLVSDLKKHFAGNVALARAAIEQASTKADAREYVGAIIRGKREADADKSQLAGGLWDRGI